MAGSVHIVARLLLLLLLSSITTGVIGDLILAERAYDIKYPCEESVCFHIWQLSTSQTSDYVAIISNGEIRTLSSEDEGSKCTLEIKNLNVEDVGSRRCQQSAPSAKPVKTASLQCVLLAYLDEGLCGTKVSLTWVDETGTEIQDDSQHVIKKKNLCDITLTVTLQSPESKRFRCQATVDEEVQTSVDLWVGSPDRRGRGRGFYSEPEPANEGRNQDAAGAAVGVVGCVVLTALVALFLVNRRRTSTQQPDEPCYTISNNHDMNGDDVIYADIILPAGPDRVRVHECESTEYACIRYK